MYDSAEDSNDVCRRGCWNKMGTTLKKHVFTRKFATSLLIGQLLSLFICGTAVTSGLLEEAGVFIPTGQSFVNYVLLAITFTTWNLTRVGLSSYKTILKERGLKYFILGILEVEANFLVIKAYQFTSVTSVQLLDCVTIPTVLILSKKFLKVKYKWQNYVGVVTCLLGAGLLILADFLTDRYTSGASTNTMLHNIIGDILCVCGATIYGILNVSQEFVIAKHGSIEYLGVIGCFGSIISAIQFTILERQELYNIDFSLLKVWLPLLIFAVCLYLFYCFMSYGIYKTSAMAVNLNLLSSDFFSLLIGLVVFNYKFNALYFGSFSLIIVGVLLYNIHPAKPEVTQPMNDELAMPSETTGQYQSSTGPQFENEGPHDSHPGKPTIKTHV